MNKTPHRTCLSYLLSGLVLLAGCTTEQKKADGISSPPTPVNQKSPPGSKTPPPGTPKAPDMRPANAPAAPAPIPAPPPKSALVEGIELYDKGDYNAAIKHLSGASEIWKGDKASQLTALKFMAFSYCVTGRQAQCRQQFEKAFKLDRSFDLAPGEKGHPLWGPAFERAKKVK